MDESLQSPGAVPVRALALFALALAIPMIAVAARPDWLGGGRALLLWIPAVLLLAALGIREVRTRERRRTEASALTDGLTGLPNRRHSTIFLERAWGSAQRGKEVSVVLFDLDFFKRINDVHGSAKGDEVLKTIADVLSQRVRRMDIFARFGGDEFISVLLECGPDKARVFADEIRSRVEELPFPWGRVTVSAGVASADGGMDSPDALITAADKALLAAKEGGRNRVCTPPVPLEGQTSSPRVGMGDGRRDAGPLVGLEVLLVDDDEDTLRSTARILTRLGCTVTTTTSARTAVEALKSEVPVDVIITDIVMPEMSGFTLVDLAMKVRQGVAVLYVSGYPQEEVYWGGTPGARSAFLAKPVEVDDLRDALLGLTGKGDLAAAVTLAAPDDEAPDAAATEDRPPSTHTVAVPPVQGRILIVDDDQDVVRSLIRLFTRAGYEQPHGITDPREAVGILESGEYDLLILDLHMPEADGFEVLAALAPVVEPGEYFPVLVLTGDEDPTVRRRALAAGAMDFLTKPFDPAEAEARVANLLRTRRLYQRATRQRDSMETQVLARTAELADTRSEILHRLARAAEYRDDITGRHATRVGLFASQLAAELGMDPHDVDLIRRTAPLHDVGKIGISDSVLLKAGRLTAQERALIQTHTLIGAEILGGSTHRILVFAREIALSHHERWDGTGYPQGLAGRQIPIAARIVAVADTFDVLTHRRPYKEPLRPEAALAELVSCSGTQFDPEVIRAFQAIAARVGIEELHEVADPIDPWRDTTGPERPALDP